ncbi:GntR family transcriptional regulator [Streptomyces sp. JJ66]|uniref:GntR family transcriptional regulator n=1 Tax=Streptomyces sp. JJ66 TaxID=2803843 RepID=UPI001C586EB3|nr:GntR family transcriptional regulator [Streptomyces sp. JJ66]MBW1604714.1 GntR family transcriptional regulator [Streptomyces sp. JJ66]
MSLDPDDPRPPYVQITNALRAAIRTKTLEPGERLPSQSDLTKRYGVSRATVQRALRDLQDEGLLVARQGSGVFVRSRTERPVGLRTHIERAFEQPHVTIDFSGFSGETLYAALQEPVDKIREGRLTPESIVVRLLLPNMAETQAVPVLLEGRMPDARVSDRARDIMLHHSRGITRLVGELKSLGLVREARVEVRTHGITPSFKLYVLNKADVFFGFYPLGANTVTVGGDDVEIIDVFGLDATLFPFAETDNQGSAGGLFVEQATKWFDSVWGMVGKESTA